MELMTQLEPRLKRLRLSGILQTLEARNRQAIDGQWSHIEFLNRLLEDEVERREQKQLSLRLRRATVNTTKTLENFDFNFNPNLNRQQVLQVASGDFIRQRHNALICGPTGVGKTHLAQALAHEACRQGFGFSELLCGLAAKANNSQSKMSIVGNAKSDPFQNSNFAIHPLNKPARNAMFKEIDNFLLP